MVNNRRIVIPHQTYLGHRNTILPPSENHLSTQYSLQLKARYSHRIDDNILKLRSYLVDHSGFHRMRKLQVPYLLAPRSHGILCSHC